VELENLTTILSKYDPEVQDYFLGYSITDKENPSVHFFSKEVFKYPDLKAGKNFLICKETVLNSIKIGTIF
jgi:hypothetical protein